MSTVTKQSIRLVAEKISPRDPEVRAKAMNALDQQDGPPLQFAGHAAGAVAWGYLQQWVQPFNRYAAFVQAAVVAVCFAFGPPQAGLYALGTVLIALSFRAAFTFQKGLLPEEQYLVDSAGDAAAAMVFVIASQGLAVAVLPSLALPVQVLYRGLLVSMPLIATLRMVLRPKPAPPEPDERSGSEGPPAKTIYRKTRWLNFLWLMTFYGVVMQNVTDKHGYFPDFLRGMLPVASFVVWMASQADDLCRRDNLVTLFTSIKAKTLRRMRGNVAIGTAAGQCELLHIQDLPGADLEPLRTGVVHRRGAVPARRTADAEHLAGHGRPPCIDGLPPLMEIRQGIQPRGRPRPAAGSQPRRSESQLNLQLPS